MDELQHHGIKGQRWGKRRFQNEDGSLTPQGRARYNQELTKALYKKEGWDKSHSKGRSDIDASVARLQLSKEEQKKLLDPDRWDKEDQEYARNNPQNYAAEQQGLSRVEATNKKLDKYYSTEKMLNNVRNENLEEYWAKVYGNRPGAFEENKEKTDNVLKQAWDTVVGSVTETAQAIGGFFADFFRIPGRHKPEIKSSSGYMGPKG